MSSPLPGDQESNGPLGEGAGFNIDLKTHVEQELCGNLQRHVGFDECNVKQSHATVEEVERQVEAERSAACVVVRCDLIGFPVGVFVVKQ